MARERELVKKTNALRMAKIMGCSGAHKDDAGNWLPCQSPEELERLSNMAETSQWRSVVQNEEKSEDKKRRIKGRRKKKRNDDWEKLRERPTGGFEHIEGAGIVSADIMAPVAPAAAPAAAMTGIVTASAKSAKRFGPEYVRETDPDVFMDPDSARERAKRLGCIGISRRMSKNGRAVWMPCTNMSDYANRSGSTALGRRNMEKRREREMERAVRTVLTKKKGPKYNKKSDVTMEIIATRYVL